MLEWKDRMANLKCCNANFYFFVRSRDHHYFGNMAAYRRKEEGTSSYVLEGKECSEFQSLLLYLLSETRLNI